jgi:AbiV family abortive infection protein
MKNILSQEEIFKMLFSKEHLNNSVFVKHFEEIENFKKDIKNHIKRLRGVRDFESMTIDYNYLINLFSQKDFWTEEEIDNVMKEIVEATKVNIIRGLFYIL